MQRPPPPQAPQVMQPPPQPIQLVRSTHVSIVDCPCTIYLEVSDLEASHIIGKGGSFQKTIMQQTGVKVSLSNRGEYYPGTTNRQVTLSGPVFGVHKAHIMILERAAEVAQRADRR